MITKSLQRKINRVRRFCDKHNVVETEFTHNGCKYQFGLLTNKCYIWIPEACEWRVVEERND